MDNLFKVCTRYEGPDFSDVPQLEKTRMNNTRCLAIKREIWVKNHPQITGSRFNICGQATKMRLHGADSIRGAK